MGASQSAKPGFVPAVRGGRPEFMSGPGMGGEAIPPLQGVVAQLPPEVQVRQAQQLGQCMRELKGATDAFIEQDGKCAKRTQISIGRAIRIINRLGNYVAKKTQAKSDPQRVARESKDCINGSKCDLRTVELPVLINLLMAHVEEVGLPRQGRQRLKNKPPMDDLLHEILERLTSAHEAVGAERQRKQAFIQQQQEQKLDMDDGDDETVGNPYKVMHQSFQPGGGQSPFQASFSDSSMKSSGSYGSDLP